MTRAMEPTFGWPLRRERHVRHAATILFAGAIGFHCTGAVVAEPPSDDGVGAPERERAREIDEAAELPQEPRIGAAHPAHETSLGGAVLRLPTTSSVVGPDGALYAVGTFEGTIAIGDERFESRGREDVFVFRREGSEIRWARSIGSVASEQAPTVSIEGGRVTVIGMTGGAMDCGAGPLPAWSSETFFFCVFHDVDGGALDGGAFPTGP
jgi:hypothetical protein